MTEDALIAEVRAARHEISEECGHDLRRLQERCRALQSELSATGHHEMLNPIPEDALSSVCALR